MPSILALIRRGVLLAAAVAAIASTSCAADETRTALSIAESEPVSLAVNTTARVATSNVISASRGSFMTVHFARFNLAQGDKVVVRDVAGTTAYEYTGLGRGDGGLSGGFYSSRLPGNQAVVEYIPGAAGSSSGSGAFGYSVDQLKRSTTSATASKICGDGDQSKPAKCYIDNADVPQAYTKSRAMVRLLSEGGGACTGWLIGSDGYMVTNHHCISSVKTALNTDYEIMAEGASCSNECKSWGACKGTILATTAQFIAADKELDYALVKLNTTVDLSQYGYFQLRTKGPVMSEQIYIPQFPNNWGKRVAVYDDDGSVARVKIIGKTVCGPYTVGYTADTDVGASGSPVVGASDNQVVALHSCSSKRRCENGGTDSRTLLWHWKKNGIVIKDVMADPNEEIPMGPWIPVVTAAPTPIPTSADPPSAFVPTPAPLTGVPTPEPTSAAPTVAPTPEPTSTAPTSAPTTAESATSDSCKIFRQQSTCTRVKPGVCTWVSGVCVPTAPATQAMALEPGTVAPTQ